MSEIRKKLRDVVYSAMETSFNKPKEYKNSDTICEMCTDAILSKFDVTPKQPREFWINCFSEFSNKTGQLMYIAHVTKDSASNANFGKDYHLLIETLHVREVL